MQMSLRSAPSSCASCLGPSLWTKQTFALGDAGGFEFDGNTEISSPNTEQIRTAADSAVTAGCSALVVSGVF